MRTSILRLTQLLAVGALCAMSAGCATTPPAMQLAGVPCAMPPPAHCPETDCPGELIANLGNAVEPRTGRKFFLDYPCDLRAGEKVIFVLSLHGGGSIGNWQRHYFPLMDLKEKYRLVIATPSGVVRAWNAQNDDTHLRNIVELVYEQIGVKNIKAFWLAGHSQGGQTSNRLLLDEFYRARLTGWVSLSGGRLGSKRSEVRAQIPGSAGGAATATSGSGTAETTPRLVADASILPEYPFSHIYTSGEHELTSAGLPSNSRWAEKLGCGAQSRGADIVDTQPGYISDTRPQRTPNKIWGLKPRPGTAEAFLYPACANGRVVADVIRKDKGHTEGLEPNVTEAIVKLMVLAK